MAREICTYQWQDKSVRLNSKINVNVKMARLNCTSNGMCTFKWQDKSVRLNGRTKVYL